MWEVTHTPVLVDEVVEHLIGDPDGIYVDATLGTGGHASKILEHLGSSGRLLALDRDPTAVEMAKERLGQYGPRVIFVNARFSSIKEVLAQEGIDQVSGILADLGVSSVQLRSTFRGFSFLSDGPLDMRMDPECTITAERLVNTFKERDLTEILKQLGEETKANKIAKAIVNERKNKKIVSPKQLSDIIVNAKGIRRFKIHPATKTFMALRIYINNELEELKQFLDQTPQILRSKGRLVIISYHSLEDRIVKNFLRNNEKSIFKIITKKPILPSRDEVMQNPSARSAKLRVGEKI